MWWTLATLVWWCGASAIPSPGVVSNSQPPQWRCPEIQLENRVECSCDMPHTLRCNGDKTAMGIIARSLRSLTPSATVSLLDCTIQNVSSLSGPLLPGVTLHGLVVSSGEIKEVLPGAFGELAAPLQALGLPNNHLDAVPTLALSVLPELDRLDLSGNKMKSLDCESFKGLRNLSFIDLSDNTITKIAAETFDHLPNMKILRLRGNRINFNVLQKLHALPTVEELDLSENSLIGPLGPNTFPVMESLKDLQLVHNSLSSIKMNALEGLTNLTSLRLQHNDIDVIEDHAFSHLSSLISLNMAHNRIVAVSGQSLAHLTKLMELDLRHNFLRALTADLILPLKSLKTLKLDDNDISIIASDALKKGRVLKHLTLSENPLNCDCSLIDFAMWLANSSLDKDDKSTVICTTPPSLENAMLIDVAVENLLCGDEEQETMLEPLATPYKAKIGFDAFHFDGKAITLQWKVDCEASSYTCDAIFIYEEEGDNEVLLESNKIKCNSTELKDPSRLQIVVPSSIQLELQHRYRYCIVLFDSGKTDDVSLLLGCSDVLPLMQHVKMTDHPKTEYAVMSPKILAVQANLSDVGTLSIDVDIYPDAKCDLNIAILEQNSLLSQRKMECTEPRYVFVGLHQGPYRVCANIIPPGPALELNKPRCITVFKSEHQESISTLDAILIAVFLVFCVIVIALVWCVRRILLKPRLHQTHQYFLPPENEEESQQHNGYVKLQATTKL